MDILTREELVSLYPQRQRQLSNEDKRKMWLRKAELEDEINIRNDYDITKCDKWRLTDETTR